MVVAKWVASAPQQNSPVPPKPVAGLVALAVASTDLLTIAECFIQLQQQRHDADYNHLVTFRRSSARQACQEVRAAIDAVDAVHGQPAWQAFATLVLLTTKVTKR